MHKNIKDTFNDEDVLAIYKSLHSVNNLNINIKTQINNNIITILSTLLLIKKLLFCNFLLTFLLVTVNCITA